jgi:hypothetical protein
MPFSSDRLEYFPEEGIEGVPGELFGAVYLFASSISFLRSLTP